MVKLQVVMLGIPIVRDVAFHMLVIWININIGYASQLRITPQSFQNHQRTVSASFQFDPPIIVELIDGNTGMLDSTGPNSNLRITTRTWNSEHCLSSDSTFYLYGGVGKFPGSLCEVTTDAEVYLYFQGNSTLGLLMSTNLTKGIRVTGDIHFAYFQPMNNKEEQLNDKLERFMQYSINRVNNGLYGAYPFHHPLPMRRLNMRSYRYNVTNPSSPVDSYISMKNFHSKHPEEKAYALIGMSNNLASKIVIPLMMEDEYAVTSFRKDISSLFDNYPYFNRIHLSEDHFVDGVFLYLKKRKWNKFTFIYTAEDEIDYAKFKYFAGRYDITIRMMKYILGMNHRPLFMSIISSGYRIIMTTATGATAKSMLLEANQYHVTSVDKFQWIGLKNERHYDFIFGSQSTTTFNNTASSRCLNDGSITMHFKGMIFINSIYYINVYNNSEFEFLWNGFLLQEKDTGRMYPDHDYEMHAVVYALAYDTLSSIIHALKGLIAANRTINGISLSQYIRANTSFNGLTNKVFLNPSTGSRDEFIGSIHIIWPITEINNITSPLEIISFSRKDDSFTENQVLSFEILKMFMSIKGGSKAYDMYNAHVPVEYWNPHCTNMENDRVNSMNKVNVTRCGGYFHSKYQMLIDKPQTYQYIYNWHWPIILHECKSKITEKQIAAPFYCEFGCGGGHINGTENINLYYNGECVAHNVCLCNTGKWEGFDCSIPLCNGCIHGMCHEPGVCICAKGYDSPNCSVPVCHDPNCNLKGGHCNKSHLCECDTNHYGVHCEYDCSCKNGVCLNNGDCDCRSEYFGSRCEYPYIFIYIVGFILAIFILLIVYFTAKGYMKEKRLKVALHSKDWVVNWSDIKDGEDMKDKCTLFLSAISMSINIHEARKKSNVGILKKINVCYQKFDSDTVKLSKEVLLEIKLLREMEHLNIVPLVGCCTEAPNVAVLTELQQKGSLQDILANGDIKIPWDLRFSLMKGICSGLAFIHQSAIKSHGRLKSSNCLVDNKWTVKLSGFGLQYFRSGRHDVGYFFPGMSGDTIKGEHCDYDSLLWTSPEILTTGVYHLDHVGCGTVNADIYSFSMVLSELCTRTTPFAEVELEKADLIRLIAGVQDTGSFKIWNDYIAKNNVEEGGPVRPCIRDRQWPHNPERREALKKLIESCWDEDPIRRHSTSECAVVLNHIVPQRVDQTEYLVSTLEMYSTNLENVVHQRNKQLQNQIQKTEVLLSRLLPKHIADDLKQGKNVGPLYFKDVTIYVSKVVGFASIIHVSTPSEIIALLSDVYVLFDNITSDHDVCKIESTSDAYTIASGVPIHSDQHVDNICTVALDMMSAFCSFDMAHINNTKLELQVGIHTGDIIAGVVGLKMPRYCLFGETIDIGGKMQTTSNPSSIQITGSTFDMLERIGGYICEYRHEVKIKSTLKNIKPTVIKTYWLKGKEGFDNLFARNRGCK